MQTAVINNPEKTNIADGKTVQIMISPEVETPPNSNSLVTNNSGVSQGVGGGPKSQKTSTRHRKKKKSD